MMQRKETAIALGIAFIVGAILMGGWTIYRRHHEPMPHPFPTSVEELQTPPMIYEDQLEGGDQGPKG